VHSHGVANLAVREALGRSGEARSEHSSVDSFVCNACDQRSDSWQCPPSAISDGHFSGVMVLNTCERMMNICIILINFIGAEHQLDY